MAIAKIQGITIYQVSKLHKVKKPHIIAGLFRFQTGNKLIFNYFFDNRISMGSNEHNEICPVI